MAMSIPIVLVLGLAALFLIRKDGLKILHMIPVVLLGFYLAGTSIGSQISQVTASVADLIGARIR